MASTTGPSPLHGSTRERQRRRKKRISRDLDDHNESLESPSSVPERIPLHEMADGDKANASAEGSSSLNHGHERTSRSRERSRRPRRKSRTENGKMCYIFVPVSMFMIFLLGTIIFFIFVVFKTSAVFNHEGKG